MVKATITIQGKTTTEFPALVRNDIGFDIQFNILQNDEETAFDLTGAVVVFKAKGLSATTNKIDSTCTLSGTPTDGICTYTVLAGDLDTSQILIAELEITQGAVINTAKIGRLSIVDDLP